MDSWEVSIALTSGIFEPTHEPPRGWPWGRIVSGQTRDHPLLARALWYSGRAEPLGRGDIDAEDIALLQRYMQFGELFIMLAELHTGLEVYRRPTKEQQSVLAGRWPGRMRYMVEQCSYIVAKCAVYAPDSHLEAVRFVQIEGVNVMLVPIPKAWRVVEGEEG